MRQLTPIVVLIVFTLSLIPFLDKTSGVAFAQQQQASPEISTVAQIRDVTKSEDDWSIATKEMPATANIYTVQVLNEEADARIKKEEKAAEETAEKQAKKEAGALAAEMVENGKYVELIGYDARYVKWYDERNDRYYEELAERFPSIGEFWFDKDGHYHYEYDADYDDIDYSDRYHYEIENDIFAIKDTLTYSGLYPGVKYTVEASLVSAIIDEPEDEEETGDSDDSNADESVIKTINQVFEAAENGSGTIVLDFGEVKLEPDTYVILATIKNEDGTIVIEHKALDNTLETIVIENIDFDGIVDEKSMGFHGAGGGKVIISSSEVTGPGTEPSRSEKSPGTGDDANATVPIVLILLMAASAVVVRSRRKI